MANRILKTALIGQGFMGRAHSNAYHQVKHFFDLPFEIERTIICGRNQATLDQMAATWGWNETATDWRTLIERKDIDIIDIATPNSLHAEIAIAAAEAGKIVFCEKPLALTEAEGERMAAAAKHVPNMVWFNYRRVPAIAYTRRLIEEDRLGRIYHYRATYLQEWGTDPTRPPSWKTQKAVAGSGVLGDLLSHVVDTALYLNGDIKAVSAMQQTFAEGRDIDDAALVLVRFANGSIGSFEATRYATGCKNANRYEIHGAKGMAAFHLENLNHLQFLDATEPRNLHGIRNMLVTGPDHPFSGNFWKPGHVIGYEHTFIAALGEFLRALADGQPFHPNFDDAQRVQRVLAAIEKASQTERWIELL